MRNIIDLDGTEYLKRTYECAQAYKKYVADSGVMDILGREPELTGTETDAERLEKRRAQANKNAVDMTKLLYTDKADLTLGILPLFVVLDKEQPPTRVLASAMSRALRDVDFMDFFQSLM